MVRGYGYGQVMVRCGGDVGLVKCGRGCARVVRGYSYEQVMVRCGGGVGLVKCGRGCARVGTWVWLWAGDGVLQLRFKCVSADAHIC